VWATTLWDVTEQPLQWGVVLSASLVAAAMDVRTRRIANWLTGPLLLAGLVWAGWIGGWAGLGDAGAACLVMAAPYVVLFVLAEGGAGDAKLMGALGSWLGLVNGTVTLVAVALCGVAAGIAFGMIHKKTRKVLRDAGMAGWRLVAWAGLGVRMPAPKAPDAAGADRMPYGLAILGGAVLGWAGVMLWRM
jgi:Flp pilus assembly protein protease CpaA